VDDGYPEADEYSNNYVEHAYRANDDREESRVFSVPLVPWFERSCALVGGYLGRMAAKMAQR
jgi:hypothetical protein